MKEKKNPEVKNIPSQAAVVIVFALPEVRQRSAIIVRWGQPSFQFHTQRKFS